jgi:hypothetical protein
MNGLLPLSIKAWHILVSTIEETRCIYSHLKPSRDSQIYCFQYKMPGKHKNRKSYRDPDRPRGQRLSERERTQVLTLYQLAGWNKSQIARQLRLPHSTVRLVIQEGNYTPLKPPGRPFMLTIRRRHRLIKRATQDGFHRRLPLNISLNSKVSRPVVVHYSRHLHKRIITAE